jgi:hypothetical protein
LQPLISSAVHDSHPAAAQAIVNPVPVEREGRRVVESQAADDGAHQVIAEPIEWPDRAIRFQKRLDFRTQHRVACTSAVEPFPSLRPGQGGGAMKRLLHA